MAGKVLEAPFRTPALRWACSSTWQRAIAGPFPPTDARNRPEGRGIRTLEACSSPPSQIRANPELPVRQAVPRPGSPARQGGSTDSGTSSRPRPRPRWHVPPEVNAEAREPDQRAGRPRWRRRQRSRGDPRRRVLGLATHLERGPVQLRRPVQGAGSDRAVGHRGLIRSWCPAGGLIDPSCPMPGASSARVVQRRGPHRPELSNAGGLIGPRKPDATGLAQPPTALGCGSSV